MNQFLIDGIPYRAVYQYVGTDHEERGGCCQLDGSNFMECCDCTYENACPADATDED